MASFGIFLATTVPSKMGLFFSDRKRFQRLTSKGYEREIELIVLRVIGVFGRDTSYLNVDENDIDKMIADENYQFLAYTQNSIIRLKKMVSLNQKQKLNMMRFQKKFQNPP